MAGMSGPPAKASLLDAASKNPQEYLVSAGNRFGMSQEIVQALFNDDDSGPFHDLVTGDVQANFLGLMESLAVRWGDEFRGEIVQGRGA